MAPAMATPISMFMPIQPMRPTTKMTGKIFGNINTHKIFTLLKIRNIIIDTLSLKELKERKIILEQTLLEIQNNDNIHHIHLEAYYSVQQQITNMIENFKRRVKEKQAQKILI
ncbi:MAG TPA: hypothetical protein EYG80_06210 [Flavobacteriaceae bacterium]|nr:hypothetical protein [Flavobacteriaceae bacterium]